MGNIRGPLSLLSWTYFEVAEKNPGYAADDVFVEEAKEAYLGASWRDTEKVKHNHRGILLDLKLTFLDLRVKYVWHFFLVYD